MQCVGYLAILHCHFKNFFFFFFKKQSLHKLWTSEKVNRKRRKQKEQTAFQQHTPLNDQKYTSWKGKEKKKMHKETKNEKPMFSMLKHGLNG